jgi:TolB protein
VACDDDGSGPPRDDIGDLRVTTATTGSNLDPDGYALVLDPGTEREAELAIGPDGTVTFPDVAPGEHTLFIGGLQFSCTITTSDPPLADVTTLFVRVVSGDTTDVLLEVTCAPPPEGRLVFMAECFVTTAECDLRNRDIYTMNADRTGRTRLTTDEGDDDEPVWSPDGSRIAWTRDGDIWLMNVDGSEQVALTNGAELNRSPAWSPDGGRLVFVSDRGGGLGLYTMDAGGGDVQPLIADGYDPAWSPDGARIAFVRNSEIYVAAADGSAPVRLIARVMYDATPAWSPDGTRIAFHRIERNNHDGDIYVMNADGSGLAVVTRHTGTNPAWSPDGARIAFDRDLGDDIFFIGEDGSAETDFTDSGSDVAEHHADWISASSAIRR